MTWPTRDELERRLHALLADHLDDLERRFPEGFDIGVQVFLSEILQPTESTVLLREDARYQQSSWRLWSSEVTGFTVPALVREAHDMFEDRRMYQEYDSNGTDEDEEKESDEDED